MFLTILLVILLDIYYFISFTFCDLNYQTQHCSFERITNREYVHSWDQYISIVTVALNSLIIVIFLLVLTRIARMISEMYPDIYR